MTDLENISVGPFPEPSASIYHDEDREALVFTVKGTEVLSMAKNGEILVYGRRCAHDTEMYPAMKEFLSVVCEHFRV